MKKRLKPAAPKAFRAPRDLRAWLQANHATATELMLRCFKTHARHRGVTYSEALDEALCFGWIDGVRRGLDDDSFSIRFSPRKATSVWSRINVARARVLLREGRMRPPGLAAFQKRRPSRYSFETTPPKLAPAYERTLRANERAWAFWQERPPWYRRTVCHWVMSARREETRQRRLDILMSFSGRGMAIPPLARTPKRG